MLWCTFCFLWKMWMLRSPFQNHCSREMPPGCCIVIPAKSRRGDKQILGSIQSDRRNVGCAPPNEIRKHMKQSDRTKREKQKQIKWTWYVSLFIPTWLACFLGHLLVILVKYQNDETVRNHKFNVTIFADFAIQFECWTSTFWLSDFQYLYLQKKWVHTYLNRRKISLQKPPPRMPLRQRMITFHVSSIMVNVPSLAEDVFYNWAMGGSWVAEKTSRLTGTQRLLKSLSLVAVQSI